MKTLITGGAGFIGSTIASACLDDQITPVIVDDLSTGRREFVEGRTFYQGDVADEALLSRIFTEHPDIDAVVHCAAKIVVPESVAQPLDYYDNNIGGLVGVLRSMQRHGCHRFLFSSSASIYAPGGDFSVDENSPLVASSPYGRTKYVSELILSDVAAASALRSLSLRYFNPVGADPLLRTGLQNATPSHAVGKMIKAYQNGKTFTITGVDWPTRDGTGIRDYIHVWDLAKAHVAALQRFDSLFPDGVTSRAINVGTGIGTTVRELATAFSRATGDPLTVAEGPPRPGDAAGCYTRSEIAQRDLGWSPERSIEEGILDSLAWAARCSTVLYTPAQRDLSTMTPDRGIVVAPMNAGDGASLTPVRIDRRQVGAGVRGWPENGSSVAEGAEQLVSSILVTGAAGFIGSNFVRYWTRRHPASQVVAFDALTYAGVRTNLEDIAGNVAFVHGDIRDQDTVERTLRDYRVDIIVNFAAESHNSYAIVRPSEFFATNVMGPIALLEAVRKVGVERFHHISTCEVYGDMDLDDPGAFAEDSPYRPRTPYNAAKASGDHAVRAYGLTYGIPITITNCSNNYGPHQFPEKLIPLFTTNALQGKPLPLYRSSKNRREWLHVYDHCTAIEKVLENGRIGDTYNVGSGIEADVEIIADFILDQLGLPQSLKTVVPDRPSHDRRYLLNSAKLRTELGWAPTVEFEEGLRQTINWYRDHEDWWRPLLGRSPVVENTAWSVTH